MCETVENFIRKNQKIFPKAEESILRFIADVVFHNGAEKEKTEDIRRLFADGYCYYFALMLQDAFPGGTICWAAPLGHIVYEYHQVYYDIDGVYDGEANSFIPIERLGEAINDFRHIPGKEYNATEQELAKIQLDWEEEMNYKKVMEFVLEAGIPENDMLLKTITSMKYPELKDKIVGILANENFAKENHLLFKRIPGTDIGITYVIKINSLEGAVLLVRLKDGILNAWNVTLEELNQVAFENMKAAHEFKFGRMYPLIAVSNTDLHGGTINILIPEVQATLKEMVDSKDFYILPSSIHECLICPKDEMPVEDLIQMVMEVNQDRNCLKENEVLSNDVYELDEQGNLVSLKNKI